mgnify:CR=1 FL=1
MNKKVNIYSFNEECYVYLNDYKQLEKENQELKKFNDKLLIHNASLMYAQKEFINYINAYIVLLNDKLDVLEEVQKDILEEILQKYKKMIV